MPTRNPLHHPNGPIRRAQIVNNSDFSPHDHHFLSKNHGGNEFKTRLVMVLCASCMVVEITCGVYFGSLALLADGIHMGTHVIAFFITAYAYSIERRYKDDERFVFGTGKVGELASFTSAIILIVIALYILYEGIYRLINPEPLEWLKSMGVAFVGLGVNIGSVLLLGCGGGGGGGESTAEGEAGVGHDHAHGHGHSHGHRVEDYEVVEEDDSDDDEDACGGHDETFFVATPAGKAILSIFEEGILPRFRLGFEQAWKGSLPSPSEVCVTTRRADGSSQIFTFAAMKAPVPGFSSLQSTEEIPEPHEFTALLQLAPGGAEYRVEFLEGEGHDHGHARHSNEDCHDHEHEHGHSAACHSGDHDHGHDHQPHSADEDDHDHDHDHAHHGSSGAQVAIEFPHPHPHPHPHPQKASRPASAAGGGQAEAAKKYHLDNNFRAAVSHVVADSFVSSLVVVAVVVAGNVKNCAFLDPLVGIIGSFVIISWAYTLVYDTSCTLLDMNPDLDMTRKLRERLEKDRSTTTLDLHVWRLGPGHLGAIVSVLTAVPRDIEYYRKKIRAFKAISHLTIEIKQKRA